MWYFAEECRYARFNHFGRDSVFHPRLLRGGTHPGQIGPGLHPLENITSQRHI
jgi:hypothetical protein